MKKNLEITVTYVRINPKSVNDGMHGVKSAAEFAVARATVTGKEFECVATSVDPANAIFVEDGHVGSRLALSRDNVICWNRHDARKHEAGIKQHAINTAVGRLGKALDWQCCEPNTSKSIFPFGLHFVGSGLHGYGPLKLAMYQVEDSVLGDMMITQSSDFGLEFEYLTVDTKVEYKNLKPKE